ncbi:MAG: hypothetical protein CSA15_06060 [Candidatus Delongbacteria bacterium]|nr:MAG: hypothetical protein CSA15_06060 [Candidatus Delongbacteria bacterium]
MKTLEEYKDWLEDIKLGKTDKYAYLDFGWELMRSPYTAYHYSLIFDESLNEEFKNHLKSCFDKHVDAEDFLFEKLENNKDVTRQGELIFLAGQVAKKHKKKILEYAITFTDSKDDYTRDRALIVLGWIGGVAQTKILENHLLNDTDTECRAWSASSYMQMWFNRRKVKEKAYQAFEKALPKETEPFVIAAILDTIREIGKTKLGISQKALDDEDMEKMLIAKEKAMRHIKRELKKINV